MEKTQLDICMERFPMTDIWMDSFDKEHHAYVARHCLKGVTTSPTWVGHMMESELEAQKPLLRALIARYPDLNEREITWRWTLEMGRERCACMLPEWEKGNPRNGRFSIQVSVFEFRSADRMLEMARQVNALGPNMQVKIPCTAAGVEAMEQATYEGISVMATLCFSVDQALCAARAMEKGLNRREAEGLPTGGINPVCAVLLGIQEDWLRGYADKQNIALDPDVFFYAGEAVAKAVYRQYKAENLRTRVLVAYYRHHRHFTAFIGGDIIMTIPYKWQKRFEHLDAPIENNMDKPVPERCMAQLSRLEPFVRATQPGKISAADFDVFEPVILTLRYFTSVYEKAVLAVRDLMLPSPL